MSRGRYDTDLTDGEWEIFEKKMQEVRTSTRGRKPSILRRDIVDAIYYRLKTGCQWRNLPHDFPAWNTVYRTYRRWILNGHWEKIHDAVRGDVRKKTDVTLNPAH